MKTPPRKRAAQSKETTKRIRTAKNVLMKADSPGEILAALANAIWVGNGGKGECPARLVPSLADIWQQWQAAESVSASDQCTRSLQKILPGAEWGVYRFKTHGEKKGHFGMVAIRTNGASPGVAHVPNVHRLWRNMDKKERPKHPLGPIVRDWQAAQAIPVKRENRKDKGILPAITIAGGLPAQERVRGMALTGAIEAPTGSLPTIGEPDALRVPLLELVDATGVPIRSKGRGAPLPMRILAKAIMSVRPDDRIRGPVEIVTTVDDFIEAFFPRHYRPSRHWPQIAAALREVHGSTIPMEDGWRWRILSLITEPPDHYKEAHLNREIVFNLNLPSGSKKGPILDLPLLDEMGRTSSSMFRAHIAVNTLNWLKGRRVPQHKGRGIWSWSRNPEHYPVFDRETRRRLSYGEEDVGNRSRRDQDEAWENQPKHEVLKNQRDAKTGSRGWRFIPHKSGKK